MADLNRISVIGRTTREIGERDYGYTTNGKARLNLSVAVNDGYGENKTAGKKTATNIAAFILLPTISSL